MRLISRIFCMVLCYRVSTTIFPLANKEGGLLSVARICIGFCCPRGANNGCSKLTSLISPGRSPRQRKAILVIPPSPSGLPLHCLRLYQPYHGLLSYRNYKRSQLKLMSLNSLALRFDCVSKAVRDTIVLTAILSSRELCALLNALLNKIRQIKSLLK